MGGGVIGGEPYENFAYDRYPFAERWVPVYESSFPSRRSYGNGYYDGTSLYDVNSYPILIFEDAYTREQNLARKRTLDALMRERRSARGQNVQKSVAEKEGRTNSCSPSSNQMQSTTGSSTPSQPHNVDTPQRNHSAAKSADRRASKPDVNTIPVILSTDVERKKSVKCTVIPMERTTRKALSVVEAAAVVQAWFRGHLVRRTHPLTHLRVIATVKSQLMELKVQTFDADCIERAQVDPTARLRLTESVMNLLLQLDAIQDAHSSVREIRKSVTKEVITLEDQVEALLTSKTAVTEPTMNVSIEKSSVNRLDQSKSMAVHETEDQCGCNVEEETISGLVAMIGPDETDNKACGKSSKQIRGPDPDQKNSSNREAEPLIDFFIAESVEVNAPNILAPEMTNEVLGMSRVRGQCWQPMEAHPGQIGITSGSVQTSRIQESFEQLNGVGEVHFESTLQAVEIDASEHAVEINTRELVNTDELEVKNHARASRQDRVSHYSLRIAEGCQQLGNEGVVVSTDEEAPESVEEDALDFDGVKMTTNEQRVTDSIELDSCHLEGAADAEARAIQNEEWMDGQEHVHSKNVSHSSEDTTLQRSSDNERERSKDSVKDYEGDLIFTRQGLSVHRVQMESNSSPRDSSYNRRSSLEGVDCMNTLVSTADREHLSDGKESNERYQVAAQSVGSHSERTNIVHQAPLTVSEDGVASGSAEDLDYQVLLLKLSEENQILKSLLVDIAKSNQFHVTAMMDVSHKLDKVERELLWRRWKKTTQWGPLGKLRRGSSMK